MNLYFFFAECTCNSLGIERSQCTAREDCVCQRSTGQCQCLPNVMGLSCDHCAPDHWNLAAGAGCEACGCDPNNSVTSSCNEVAATHEPQPEIHLQVQEILLIYSFWLFFFVNRFQFTGKCQCRDGFGGKTCTDCQENYWGDPRTQCRGERETHWHLQAVTPLKPCGPETKSLRFTCHRCSVRRSSTELTEGQE